MFYDRQCVYTHCIVRISKFTHGIHDFQQSDNALDHVPMQLKLSCLHKIRCTFQFREQLHYSSRMLNESNHCWRGDYYGFEELYLIGFNRINPNSSYVYNTSHMHRVFSFLLNGSPILLLFI